MRNSLLFAALMGLGVSAGAAPDPAPLYQQHCVACHGADRLGGMGPALLPQNLERLKKPEALSVIASGRPATQMLGFKDRLKPEEIEALADFIYTPPAVMPQWGEAEIRASRVEPVKPGSLADKPVFSADPLNLFVVVEAGDHHVTILDGDKFEPIHRFPSRFALHGGPKFTPDGGYVFFCLPRRLDQQIRYLQPENGGGNPRQHQHPQYRGVRRRAVGDGGQLSATYPGAVEGGGFKPEPRYSGGERGRQEFAGVGGVRRCAAPELRGRAQGYSGSLGTKL